MKQSLVQLFLIVLFAASCISLDHLSSKGSIPRSSDLNFFKDNLQSWDDWVSKRNLGNYPWRIGEFSGDKFQNWDDWLYKRRFGDFHHDNDFSGFDKSKLQEWKHWSSKRNSGSAVPFPHFDDVDSGQFQKWNDWVSKRMFDSNSKSFGPAFGSRVDFQNWADYAKRQDFVYPSAEFGISGSPYLQNWQDWVKRTNFGHTDINNNGDRLKKRQLGPGKNNYDSFRRYFTEGLQDWRSTFKNSKRDNKDEKREAK